MNNLRIQLNYYSNFKIFLKSKKHLVFCKKFLSFLYLLNYLFLKKDNLINISFFFKKKKQNIFVILKAPYKNKLSRNQLTISRYFFNFNLYFKLNNFFLFTNFSNFFLFTNFLKNFFFFFESNVCFLHSQKVFINFFFKNLI